MLAMLRRVANTKVKHDARFVTSLFVAGVLAVSGIPLYGGASAYAEASVEEVAQSEQTPPSMKY